MKILDLGNVADKIQSKREKNANAEQPIIQFPKLIIIN